MARDDRQDINKLRSVAGSDLPPRGKGVTADNTKSEKATGKADVGQTVKPKGYKGLHRDK